MRLLILTFLAILLHSCKTPYASEDYELIIQNVKLFDGDSLYEHATVLVQRDTIAEILLDETEFTGQNVIEGKGKTLIPGLINAHVHVNNRKNKTDVQQLQEAAQAGVLTVLDLFREAKTAQRLREMRDTPGQADFFSAGPLATIPSAHGTQWIPTPTLSTPVEAAGFVQDRIAEGADFIKIVKEESIIKVGMQDDVLYELVKESQKAKLVSVVHVDVLRNALVAFDAGANGIAHMWLWDKNPIDEESLAHLASRPFFVTPTLMLYKHEPIYQSTGLPMKFFAAQVKQLQDAGITILAGTDADNFGMNLGVDLHEESEIYVVGGMTPVEALKAATSNIADAYRLNDRGRIAVGKRADLILIEGDPTEEIKDLAKISNIWQIGEEITPYNKR